MAITIDVPSGDDALMAFLTFHDEVYAARTAHWTAPVPFQLPLLQGEGPFAVDREIRPFVARDGGRTVARVLAVLDRRYQRHWNESLGHVVMFEARPDTQGAVRDLMNAACTWLEARGATAVRAGMGLFDFPFTIDAYETLPPAFVRQNPAYYHGLLKDAGFETEQGLVDYRITVRPELVTRWESALAAAQSRGFVFRPLATLPPEQRVETFTTLWNETFARHFGFFPFSTGEFVELQEALAPAGMLDLSLIAFRDDEPLGVLWAVPDTSFLAQLAPGRTLHDREHVNFLGLGVRASARGQGLNLAMPAHAYLDLARRGATHASYTIVLDDNWPSRRTAEKLGAEVCASYVAYRRNLRR